MKNKKILIIEDDISIGDILNYKLTKEGYKTKLATTATAGLEYMKTFLPNLVLLDLMLPDKSGFEICKEINNDYQVPIIMLTARDDIVDKVLGLELGADDYITKPFDIREVAARVKAALRRSQSVEDTSTQYLSITKDISINTQARLVYKNEEEVILKPKEYDLLLMLAKNKNIVLTRETLLDKVWGLDFEGSTRTVDVHIQRIRKKLDLMTIETVFGLGYMLRC